LLPIFYKRGDSMSTTAFQRRRRELVKQKELEEKKKVEGDPIILKEMRLLFFIQVMNRRIEDRWA
jgi:hypothetical protein